MPETHGTMIGCPSCAGCLTLSTGPSNHAQYACSVGHSFSLWELYEAKETELERTQWSAMALLMHLQHILQILLDVRDSGSQIKIVLSRSHPDFIRRLFEAEVPEVAERVIEIKAALLAL